MLIWPTRTTRPVGVSPKRSPSAYRSSARAQRLDRRSRLPPGVRLGSAAVALALEVIGEDDQALAARHLQVEFRAVAAEDLLSADPVVDVAADRLDDGVGPGHQPDVDPALVVAVDQHDVVVGTTADGLQHLLVEAALRNAVLGLDDDHDVGVDVAQDAVGVLGRDLVHRLPLQLQPTDPLVAAVRDDLDPAGPW